ncbi:hypothetical protein RCG24_10975 [Neobacillus sp. OS1-32]|jgi:hypothetical protein|uniref:Sensor histidine kinase n=1 Tax=Neobacillus paridis TaxID=2803862 RepID=A0ABS1TP72_9BACI|nr:MULTISPECIES: hypothetical protein [Neobacillus]MBL4953108.1 hypothetical protein [Neobacillus paridis]WML32306.1 hypothetical protein RCG24_10975 [Neobacillus sp. OS1-32]
MKKKKNLFSMGIKLWSSYIIVFLVIVFISSFSYKYISDSTSKIHQIGNQQMKKLQLLEV